MNQCTDTYRVRRWHTYVMSLDELQTKAPPLTHVDTQYEVLCCNSNSERARRIGTHSRRFYFDFECRAAGMDPLLGGYLYRLREPWRDHPAGRLVLHLSERPSVNGCPAAVSQTQQYVAVELDA